MTLRTISALDASRLCVPVTKRRIFFCHLLIVIIKILGQLTSILVIIIILPHFFVVSHKLSCYDCCTINLFTAFFQSVHGFKLISREVPFDLLFIYDLLASQFN